MYKRKGCSVCNLYKLHNATEHKLPYIPVNLLLLSYYDERSAFGVFMYNKDVVKIIIMKFIELRNKNLEQSMDYQMKTSNLFQMMTREYRKTNKIDL
jgi:hypothetical protein